MVAEPKVEAWPRKWLTPLILVLLKEESSYGYEIMERLEEEFGFEQINPGTVYRTLRQMENEGLCKSEWKFPEGGPARRIYSVTEAGEAQLDIWAEGCERYQQNMDAFLKAHATRQPIT